MADHYPQPFYRLPYAYPQQQQQPQSAPADEQGRLPHMQQAPAPDAFASIPGLQHAGLPGINLAAYGHNSQQPAFPPPSAWPPQLPPDPSAWLPFFHQNGMIPPPPLPGFAAPPLFPPQPPHGRAMPIAALQQHPIPASERVQEVMESDREDGELSEREPSSQPGARNPNHRGRYEPPRSAPQASRTSPRVEEGYNPDRPAAGQAGPQESVRKVDKIQNARDEAKQFIKVLNSNNITYRTLANEELDLELLRGLYQSLNLPSEPAPILPPKTNGAPSSVHAPAPATLAALPPVSSTKPQQQTSAPAVNTNITAAPAIRSAASPTVPVDRKDYIARLQAAKLAKQGGAAKPSPPQNTSPATAPTPVPAVKTPKAAATPSAKQPVTDEQRARNTELIRQRLEAIKAKQKPADAISNGTVGSAPWPQNHGLGGTRTEQAAQPASSATSTQNTPSYTPSFPGIPGLFMNAPSFNSGPSIAPKPLSSVPQKRPAPSGTEVSTPRGSVTPYARPLGRSPQSYHEESLIIEVSGDETNGSEMDIDDDHAAAGPPAAFSNANQNPRQIHGNTPSFPSRSGSVIPASSAVSTSGPQTPATPAQQKERDERAAMLRIRIRKQMLEKRDKDQAAAAAALASSSLMFQDLSTPEVPSTDASRHNTVDPARDNKRLRRAEIQSRLPSLDAEIASNTSRMAQITKEMEELMAHNKRIAMDKDQLTQELESLGIDTEGMSHAELRAKKDEIEQEASPEPVSTSRGAIVTPQPPTGESPGAFAKSPGTEAPNVTVTEGHRRASLPPQSQVSGGFALLPGLGQVASQQQESQAALLPMPAADRVDPVMDDNNIALHGTQRLAPQENLNNAPTHTNTVEPFNLATFALSTRGSATPLDEDEDFYSPVPPGEMDLGLGVTGDKTSQLEAHSVVAKSPSEEGELEMSQSEEDEEEEYEPEEPTIITDTPIQEAQVRQLKTTRSIDISQDSTEDEEAYEPPDVDQEMSGLQSEVATAEPVFGVSQIEAEDGAMDIATSSDDSSDDSESDEETTPESGADNSISANAVRQHDTNIADDLAPEIQPGSLPAGSSAEAMTANVNEDEPARFTPYESPLRMFKSYRYHPSFAADVAGGFLSLTFSHQIDQEKPLCQFEAAGGSCNDPACSDQHFRDIGITGDKLLVQLGTANPGKTNDEKQKWNDGLRGVLKELRQKNIKDPNGIAVEIAKYRRQFLNDDTRVVNL